MDTSTKESGIMRAIVNILCVMAFAQAATTAQVPQDPFSLSLDAMKAQVDAAEQRVDLAADALRQANLAATPDQKQLETLTAQLKTEVRAALELTLQLQRAQLADAEANIAASRKRLEARKDLAEDIVARRVAELLKVSPDTVSPQAAIAAMERYGRAKDFKGYASVLTDDEADRFAGMLMQSLSMTTTLMSLAPQSGQGAAAEAGQISEMQQILAKFMKPEPPDDAMIAYKGLSTTIMSGLFSQMGATVEGQPVQAARLSAEDLKDQMRISAGVLTDARGFVAAVLNVASSSSDDKSETEATESQWTFAITGDVAVARRAQPASPSSAMLSTEIRLQRVRGEWKIAQLGSDEELLKFSAGPTVTASSSAAVNPAISSAEPLTKTIPYPAESSPPASIPGPGTLARPGSPSSSLPTENEPLYQSVTRSEWQTRFANETEPGTRIEAAQALVALAARDTAEEKFERCMTLGAELMESGFGENATRYVFAQESQTYGQEYCLWVYQPLPELMGKWNALLNQADAALDIVPPLQLAEMLIAEAKHDSLPRAAFAAVLIKQNRINRSLKKSGDARKLTLSELKRSDDQSLRYALLRTLATFYDGTGDYDGTRDAGSEAGKLFLAEFHKAGEELAASPIADFENFGFAKCWFELQKKHHLATQDLTARIVLRMLVFNENATYRVVLLREQDREESHQSSFGGRIRIGESFRNEWIDVVNEYLKTQTEADPTKVSPAVVGTINEFLRTQTPDEMWNTEETAILLTPLLESYFDTPGTSKPDKTIGADLSLQTAWQMSPHSLLSTILHCGGEIPRSVIDGVSSYSPGPGMRPWAASPFQYFKAALESADIQGDLHEFRWPDDRVDLVFLAVASELTGISNDQDQKLIRSLAEGMPRSARDLQVLALPTVQKLLKRIEEKTRNDALRDAVRKLLPQNEAADPTSN